MKISNLGKKRRRREAIWQDKGKLSTHRAIICDGAIACRFAHIALLAAFAIIGSWSLAVDRHKYCH